MGGSSADKTKEVEADNRRLQQEVEELRAELKQRDMFIASLEAQIKNLIMDGEQSNNRKDFEKNGTPSRSGLPPKPPTKNGIHRPKGRGTLEEEDESTSPPRPLAPRRQSLQPPSRSEVEMSSPLPAPKQSVYTRMAYLVPRPGALDSTIASAVSMPPFETDDDGETSTDLQSNDDNASDDSVVAGQIGSTKRRVLHTTTGPIKALPRELSIFDSPDDEVTKYSIDENFPTYYLEAAEMLDAYNARGLYTGSVSRKGEIPHGRGLMKYHHQGRSYDGEWVYGHWHGMGRIKNAHGDIYEGPVVNDLREGIGKLYYTDGRVFEGIFQQDDPVNGTLTFPDGARYVGELHNGSRHGYGIYYFTDNSTYEGFSVMNVFEGEGKMTWTDGGWYEGEWLQGEIHGYGMEVRADGSLRHKGQWSKGVPIRY